MNKWIVLGGVFYLIIAPLFTVGFNPGRIFVLGSVWNVLFGDLLRDAVFGIILILIGWIWPDKEE